MGKSSPRFSGRATSSGATPGEAGFVRKQTARTIISATAARIIQKAGLR